MKYKAENLREFAEQAMVKGGMGTEQAASTARLLLEADLMGHTTHGLALCGPYIKSVKAGDLKPHGEVNVVKDSGGRKTSWLVVAHPGRRDHRRPRDRVR